MCLGLHSVYISVVVAGYQVQALRSPGSGTDTWTVHGGIVSSWGHDRSDGFAISMILVKSLEVVLGLCLLGALGLALVRGLGSVFALVIQLVSEVFMLLGLHSYMILV